MLLVTKGLVLATVLLLANPSNPSKLLGAASFGYCCMLPQTRCKCEYEFCRRHLMPMLDCDKLYAVCKASNPSEEK